MIRRVPAVLLLLACGCDLVDRWASHPGELKESAKLEPDREETILRAHFPHELAQKLVAHLVTNDLAYFEPVPQPRSAMEPIVTSHGQPDSIQEIDLAAFGVPQRARAHYYGRLGLLTPAGRDDEVFWILISAAEN